MAPTVYIIPPATKRAIPTGDNNINSFFMAKIIIHPIKIYNKVDAISYFPTQNTFIIIPKMAKVHIIQKIVHPTELLKIVNVKGVYVPAINK